MHAPGNAAPQHSADARDLLQRLLTRPPRPRKILRPVVLQSVIEKREHTLQAFLRRTWVDHALEIIEYALLAILVISSVVWLAQPNNRELLASWLMPTPAPIAASLPVAQPASVLRPTQRHLSPPGAKGVAVPNYVHSQSYTLPWRPPLVPDRGLREERSVTLPPAVPLALPQTLSIPRLNLQAPIVEVFVVNGAWQVAEYAAGFHHGSALPGSEGNTVLAGHAGAFGGVFRDLGALRPGDEIQIEAGTRRFVYRVRELRQVWPYQTEVIDSTPTPTLTLITCTSWDTQRLLVVADLAGEWSLPAKE